MSHRKEQLEAAIKRAVGQALAGGLSDPRLAGVLVTVTEARLSQDFHEAVVSISVLPERAGRLALDAVTHAAGHLRAEVGRRVETRRLPRLVFRLDESLKKQAAVLKAIREAVELEKPPETDRSSDSQEDHP